MQVDVVHPFAKLLMAMLGTCTLGLQRKNNEDATPLQ